MLKRLVHHRKTEGASCFENFKSSLDRTINASITYIMGAKENVRDGLL